MYLESFTLPLAREKALLDTRAEYNGGYIDNPYPCGLFRQRGLKELWFKPVTILYGTNGSGKSTLLNLISQKLQLNRIAPFNSGEMFSSYAEACSYTLGIDDEGFPHRIPNGSRIITSDDIFDYMLTVRTNNNDISENKALARESWGQLRYGETVKMTGMQDYEALRMQVFSRRKSLTRRQFIRKTAGSEAALASNGETAISYFSSKLKNDTLYLLDEPENSLAPPLQFELAEMLRTMARYCGCQFIIATHSPFLLALEDAKIYDLDACPADVKQWWQLDSCKTYYEFFSHHRSLFEPYTQLR